MSDERLLSRLKISQSNRFYFYSWTGDLPVSSDVVAQSSANVHLIPANEDVRKVLDMVKPGQTVELKGLLVDIDSGHGRFMRTSLTRSDRGAGACEILFVESAQRTWH
jgi:hypothetical protein